MMMSRRLQLAMIGAVCAASTACSSSDPAGPAPEAPLPEKAFQEITAQLVARAKVPGAIVGVIHGDQRWIGAAGSVDLAGHTPMSKGSVFRAASITKMFTASLVMQEVEAGTLKLEDKLSSWQPAFPNAETITLDQLLSHTAGVTTMWFDQPELQMSVIADLTHVYTPTETLGIMTKEPPFGAPGSSGMQYSNTDYVLLGDVVTKVTGSAIGDLMKKEIFDTIPLAHTSYQFDNPPNLVSGWYEYGAATLDMTTVPQEAFVSFAGAAGAVHTTADDLLTFADAVFRKRSIVGASSLARMMTPAESGSWYAHGLMRFCPCTDGADGPEYTGWGHAGNLPGYWSEVVYYPDRDVIIVTMINRDMVNGVMLDHTVFNPTLSAVLDALESPSP